MKLKLLLFIGFISVSSFELVAQLGSYIQFDSYKAMKVVSKFDLGIGPPKMKFVKYFVLTDELNPDFDFTQTKIPVGFAAYELKKYLMPDINVNSAFKKFRILYCAPIVGVPLGTAIFIGGVYTHTYNTFNLSERALKGYPFYFLAGTLSVVVGSIFLRYKSWIILEDAVSMHNRLIAKEDRALNRLKLNPTLINSGLGIKPVLGLNLSFSLN